MIVSNCSLFFRRNFCNLKNLIHRSSTTKTKQLNEDLPQTMSAWQIHDNNGIEDLRLVADLELPIISSPCDVLIQVKAASINKLDLMMTGDFKTVVFIYKYK